MKLYQQNRRGKTHEKFRMHYTRPMPMADITNQDKGRHYSQPDSHLPLLTDLGKWRKQCLGLQTVFTHRSCLLSKPASLAAQVEITTHRFAISKGKGCTL